MPVSFAAVRAYLPQPDSRRHPSGQPRLEQLGRKRVCHWCRSQRQADLLPRMLTKKRGRQRVVIVVSR